VAVVNTTNFDPALKQIYRDSNVESLVYKTRVLMGLLPKFEGFGGKNMPIVAEYGNPQGRSATFSEAQDLAKSEYPRLEDFLLTRVSDYQLARLETEVIEATRGDVMAFLQALKTTLDGSLNNLANEVEFALFRDGTGSRGSCKSSPPASTGVATTILELTQPEEIVNFEVGMRIVAAASATGALRDTGDNETIKAVDRVQGRLTGTDATSWATKITGMSDGDHLFVKGDRGSGASPAIIKISGLARWFPSANPTGGESYFGVDRSVDSRLYGQRHDGSLEPMEEALIKAQSKSARESGFVECVVMHHAQVRKLLIELGAKKEYSEVPAQNAKGGIAGVGYRGVRVHGDYGDMSVVSANRCQADIAWALDKSSLLLATLGKPTRLIDEDGNRILRVTDADEVEARWVFRGNFGCKRPNANVRITLANP
jgi:hypothetical protein